MSTENDATAPLPLGGQRAGQHADQPTAPIRRPANARTDDPTLVFETFDPERPDPQRTDRTPSAEQGSASVPPAVPGSGSTALPVPGDRDAAPDGAPDGDREPRPSLRVGTVVWGLVIAIIGAGLIAIASGARFDVELAFIGLLALAGIALVVGSVVTGARRRR